VGVQRQYTGTAGRIEYAQVAVFLTYATARGHALIDRALYLPRSWADDPQRCTDAGIPTNERCFATKPALATALIARAVAANVPAAWVAGDEVYGADPRLRAAVRSHGLGYVLAVAANRRVPTSAGGIRVDRLPAHLPKRAWQQHSAGPGSHGHRYYSWAWIGLLAEDDTDTGHHYLLIRRNDVTGSATSKRSRTFRKFRRPAAEGVLRSELLVARPLLGQVLLRQSVAAGLSLCLIGMPNPCDLGFLPLQHPQWSPNRVR
jgi:hypothetical protein